MGCGPLPKVSSTTFSLPPSSFAATKNELHDFSPDREPLLSMLEGEVQAMYVHKPGEPATGALWRC